MPAPERDQPGKPWNRCRRAFHHASQSEPGSTGSRKLHALKVIGNDTTVTMAAEAGQLQLNVMAGYRSGDVRIHPHSEQRVLPTCWKMR